MTKILIRSAIIICSAFLSVITFILLLNLLRLSLVVNNINYHIINIFDNSYSNNPLTYIKFGVLTLILLVAGNYLNLYLDSQERPKERRVVVRRVNHYYN